MATMTKDRPRKARMYRPRPGDRISFGGLVYIVSVDVATGGLAVQEDEDAEDVAVAIERLQNPVGTISLSEIMERDADVAY